VIWVSWQHPLLRNKKAFLFVRSIWSKCYVIYGNSGKGFQLCTARGTHRAPIRNGIEFLYPSVCQGGKPCDNHFPTVAFIPSLKMKISNLLKGFRKCFSVWCYRINVSLYRVIQEEMSLLWKVTVWIVVTQKVRMNMCPILNYYQHTDITSAQPFPVDLETVFIFSLQITQFRSNDPKKQTESIGVVQIATLDFCGFLQFSSKYCNVSMSTCIKTFASHVLPNSSLTSLLSLMSYVKFISKIAVK
jgi:hypothetical protein